MMNRRIFLAATLLMTLSPAAWAAETLNYSPGLIQKALGQGKTVFVDYAASWCSTCARQERVISALRAEDPSYDKAMIFVRVDWDDFKQHEVTRSRNIPRRSTLLVLQGDDELGRIVAGTRKSDIKDLMDKGVKAGS